MATAVGTIVLAAVASIIVMSVRIVYKNQEIDASATNTRLVQEHINGEMSIAISQTSPVSIRPAYSLPSTTTPTRYARVAYKVQIGSFATVSADTAKTASAITISCPSDIVPKMNDYVLMDTPNLGAGIRVTAVSGSAGTYTLTLETTLLAGTIDNDAAVTDVAANSLVRIQRQRAYETIAPSPSTNPVTELHWYETWYEPTAADTPYVVLSKNVDASSRYMFAQIPEEPATPDPSIEPAVSWQFSYVSVGNGAVLPGSTSTYYQTNYAEGMIMPKSGNPLNTSSILGGGSTTTTTTSTTTSSTTTSSTTSSISTTSTTTSVSTSSTTTSVTTTSTTTSVSTSSTTSTSTSSVSSTSISTSSTSLSTTTATTSLSTTSVSTSATTTSSTSATTSSTTTSVSTTSTTSSSTTSISTSTSTTSVTTTSIPFDG